MLRSCQRGDYFSIFEHIAFLMWSWPPKVVILRDRRPLLTPSWTPKLFQWHFLDPWKIGKGAQTDRCVVDRHWDPLKTVSRNGFEKTWKNNDISMRKWKILEAENKPKVLVLQWHLCFCKFLNKRKIDAKRELESCHLGSFSVLGRPWSTYS